MDSYTGKPTSNRSRVPMYGLYWPGTAAWLPEKLSEWKWRLEEIESVGGDPCARIVAAQAKPYADFEEILWLDLNHDCVVRRYRSPAIKNRRAGRDFIVDEFQRLDGRFWFPKRGRIQLGGRGRDGVAVPYQNQIFVITEAAVNISLDLARFEPPTPPVGTPVNDRGRAYRYGVSAAPGGTAPNNGIAARVYASPPRPAWLGWSVALATASVSLLAGGFWLSRRK